MNESEFFVTNSMELFLQLLNTSLKETGGALS